MQAIRLTVLPNGRVSASSVDMDGRMKGAPLFFASWEQFFQLARTDYPRVFVDAYVE